MASTIAASTLVAPVAFAAASSAATSSSDTATVRAFTGLKSSAAVPLFGGKSAAGFSSVQNGSRVHCMQVWNPLNNLKFETLSYLPAMTPEQIASQIDYMLRNRWIPCLEFDMVGTISRVNFQGSGYYDNRYWTMWKLPMFGCTDAAMVLREIQECKKAYPKAFIRVMGFDNKRQVQVTGFIANKP